MTSTRKTNPDMSQKVVEQVPQLPEQIEQISQELQNPNPPDPPDGHAAPTSPDAAHRTDGPGSFGCCGWDPHKCRPIQWTRLTRGLL